jgi:hypothetical protein
MILRYSLRHSAGKDYASMGDLLRDLENGLIAWQKENGDPN